MYRLKNGRTSEVVVPLYENLNAVQLTAEHLVMLGLDYNSTSSKKGLLREIPHIGRLLLFGSLRRLR